MTESILTQFILPLVLALIMFGMGLSLTKQDFLELGKEPKAIFVGLLGQVILLPILAFSIALLLDLDSHLAVGLMLVAACPGGTSSNIISHIARANLALSVSLTAVTTIICVVSTPLIIQLAINHFDSSSTEEFSLVTTTLGLIIITLLPVLLGISLRHKFPEQAKRSEAFFRGLSTSFLVLMIVAICYQEKDTLAESFSQVFSGAVLLNLMAITFGVLLGSVFQLSKKNSLTLGIEVGIQNGSMAILIAVSFLDRPEYAIAGGVYGLTMYLGASLLILAAKRFKQINPPNSG
ncbi:bile acid:sodium symporter family protein [Paraglaciecola sp.]|uniref:bile acid:sodium symporter family protein n=1 Tax=Paraglaciecola sp. TaxID=1920173 RepID=UPI003EF9D7A9